MLTLLAMAVALRCTGALARSGAWIALRITGWLCCMTATWMVAGALGIAFPLWPALALGLVGAVVETTTSDRTWIFTCDLGLLLSMSLWALPPPQWLDMLLLLSGLTVVWTGLEAWARLTPVPLRVATGVGTMAALVALGARVGPPEGDPLRPTGLTLLHLTVIPACEGERVELPTGGVAWYDAPMKGRQRPGALLFHGADPRGGRQPAACSLRRALLDAGFAVLALDHPGYGASPPPSIHAGLETWDPLPSQLAAMEWLESRDEVTEMLVVAGHSMGAVDAIRLLGAVPESPVTFLFGGGLRDPPERDQYWYERFHTDRNLSERLPVSDWRTIRTQYYDYQRAARELPSDHGDIVFVQFGWEWDNLLQSREEAFRAIPGNRERWDLSSSSHYFNAFFWYGLVAADAGVIRSVAAGVQDRTEGASRVHPQRTPGL